jgi:hypothetical protein
MRSRTAALFLSPSVLPSSSLYSSFHFIFACFLRCHIDSDWPLFPPNLLISGPALQTRSAMAREGDRSASADKGKGKVDDVKDLPGGKKPQKDDKSAADGKKKEEEPKEGGLIPDPPAASCPDRGADKATCLEELSEEDLQLKNDLEMLVERLKVWPSQLLSGAER